MKYLFSDEGRAALKAALHARPLLAFDFDGTLAPIVRRPDEARVPDALSLRLERLSRLRPLAVITGRTVDDVSRRLGASPNFIVGNHGAEDPGQPLAFDPRPLDGLRARIAAQAEALSGAGIDVEDKRYSIALHYRLARDQRKAVTMLEALLADSGPALRCFGGKRVMNVVVADAPDKGDAVVSLVQRAGCSAAIFIGDDVNDEAVYLRAEPNWLTVRVGGDDRSSRAAFFLSSQTEMTDLLDKMLRILGARCEVQGG